MTPESNYNRLEYWIEDSQSKGKLAFSLEELRQAFRTDTETAIKRMLDRMSEKHKIVSIFRTYYLIIPAQYSSKRILPPTMFIDGLMKFLERKYYVALLNAAALHGASHQQPQEFFVVTEYPSLRATVKKGIKINYISTKRFPPDKLLQKKKTETGYISLSNPLLTALDLIYSQKRIGGLNRASTVISELAESIKPSDISAEFIEFANVSTLQRLGYILEHILNQKSLAEKINLMCKKAKIKFYVIPLKSTAKNSNSIIDDKWKLMINTKIEID